MAVAHPHAVADAAGRPAVATATAGTIALLDNTAAGSGNTLWSFDVLAVAYNTPFTVDLQTPFSVGLFLDFTTTADVKCMVRFR